MDEGVQLCGHGCQLDVWWWSLCSVYIVKLWCSTPETCKIKFKKNRLFQWINEEGITANKMAVPDQYLSKIYPEMFK